MLKSPFFLLSLAGLWSYARAVTVYGQQGMTIPAGGTSTTDAAAAATSAASTSWISNLAAYNNVTLTPPALPSPMPSTNFPITVLSNANSVNGLSVPQKANFLGFSIEMSVVQQVIGKNASFIQVPFLNLLATIADRAGSVIVRVGGNTQETATLVDSLPNNTMIAKDKENASNPVCTLSDCFRALRASFFVLSAFTAALGTKRMQHCWERDGMDPNTIACAKNGSPSQTTHACLPVLPMHLNSLPICPISARRLRGVFDDLTTDPVCDTVTSSQGSLGALALRYPDEAPTSRPQGDTKQESLGGA